MTSTLTLLVIALVLALLLYTLASWWQWPFSVLLLIGGMLTSPIIAWLELDTGIRWFHIRDITFNIFLPLLVFESALHIPWHRLKKVLLSVLMLALPMMILATLAIAALLYFSINHPGFPWVAALLCASIIAATDPVAVVALLKKVGASDHLTTLLEGESLLNDAAAIVLFSTLLAAALTGQTIVNWLSASGAFLQSLIGGIILGLIGAWVVRQLAQLSHTYDKDHTAFSVFTLVAVYGSYLFAEHALHVSGVTTVLIIGISLANKPIAQTKSIWAYQAFIANALVFLLMGLTVQWSMFTERYWAIVVGLIAVLIVRLLGIFSVLPLVSRLPGAIRTSTKEKVILTWGGLRGAIAAALALSLPLELSYWFTIQSIAYGVIIFTLFVQAPTIPWLLAHKK